MVKIIRNLFLFLRFKRAIRRCEQMNAKRSFYEGKYIVANICGRPYIMNRKTFKKLRTKGFFRATLKWESVYKKRVTYNTLEQWIS